MYICTMISDSLLTLNLFLVLDSQLRGSRENIYEIDRHPIHPHFRPPCRSNMIAEDEQEINTAIKNTETVEMRKLERCLKTGCIPNT